MSFSTVIVFRRVCARLARLFRGNAERQRNRPAELRNIRQISMLEQVALGLRHETNLRFKGSVVYYV